MKIRKNLLLVVLALTLSFVLSACGSSNPSAEEPETTEPETVEIDANGENVLIAYFSVMETDGVDTVAGASRVAVNGEVLGNNEYIAQIIQRETAAICSLLKQSRITLQPTNVFWNLPTMRRLIMPDQSLRHRLKTQAVTM